MRRVVRGVGGGRRARAGYSRGTLGARCRGRDGARRRGFTLIEVVVSLVITSVVATMAYAAAQSAFAAQEQLEAYREGDGGEAVVRALLVDAMRHQVEGLRGGPAILAHADRVERDGSASDSLQLTTLGVVSPLGSGASWQVALWRRGDTLQLEAVPAVAGQGGDVSAPIPPRMARLGGVRAFDVAFLGRGLGASWRPDWPEGDVAPDAITVTIEWRSRPPSRLLVRRGLERAP